MAPDNYTVLLTESDILNVEVCVRLNNCATQLYSDYGVSITNWGGLTFIKRPKN